MPIALYHFHVGQIKRSQGQSAIAAAAYRAGEKLYSEYYGEESDFTKKGGVVHTEILLPSHAPPAYSDRQTLWNEVEKAERGKKAQLAYSFDIALQNELTLEENISLARTFLQNEFVSRGMIVDFAVHDPDREPGGIANPHFHVLCPIRPLKENGEWDAKQHREYLVDENGDPVLDDAGHRKFNAVPTTDWGTPEQLEQWRTAWAELCNAKFEEKGLDVRIDNRSYERQGSSQIPTIHEGPAVREMEKRGISTELGNLNRFIQATNRMMQTAIQRLTELREWVKKLVEEPPDEPTVADILNRYFDERNAGAYSRKAKLNNLKTHAEIFRYLQERNICTVEDLKVLIDEMWKTSSSLKESMKAKSDRMKEIQELLRMVDYYRENKPVADQLGTQFFKHSREKYAKEHAEEIQKFRMAQRKLKPFFTQEGKLPIKKWRKELEQLQADYQADKEKYSCVYHDSHNLFQIKSCVEDAVREKDTQPKVQRAQEVSL